MNPPTAAAHQPVRTGSGGFARAGRTVAGGLLLFIGAALLVRPGPGLLVIVAGLAVLAVDYHWPRRLLEPARARLTAARNAVTTRRRTTPTSTGDDRSDTDGAAP